MKPALVVLAVLSGALLAVLWLSRDVGEQPREDAPGGKVAAAAPGTKRVEQPEDRVPASRPATPASVPARDTAASDTPATIMPLVLEPDARDGRWHEVRGVTLRAADGSATWGATVIAMQRDVAANGWVERARCLTDVDGRFTLSMPRDVERFAVFVPAPGRSRDDTSPASDREVAVRVEWEQGDPESRAVTLILETGWRLDLRLDDGDGRPRAGVVVSCDGRTATSDARGAVTLLDLPVGEPSVTLALQLAPGASRLSRVVDSPPAGQLVLELRWTLP